MSSFSLMTDNLSSHLPAKVSPVRIDSRKFYSVARESMKEAEESFDNVLESAPVTQVISLARIPSGLATGEFLRFVMPRFEELAIEIGAYILPFATTPVIDKYICSCITTMRWLLNELDATTTHVQVIRVPQPTNKLGIYTFRN